jgi:hypothetical protein
MSELILPIERKGRIKWFVSYTVALLFSSIFFAVLATPGKLRYPAPVEYPLRLVGLCMFGYCIFVFAKAFFRYPLFRAGRVHLSADAISVYTPAGRCFIRCHYTKACLIRHNSTVGFYESHSKRLIFDLNLLSAEGRSQFLTTLGIQEC